MNPAPLTRHRFVRFDDLWRHRAQRSHPTVGGFENGESVSVLGAGFGCSTDATPTCAGRQLRFVVLRCRRPELHRQLHRRIGDGHPGTAHHHCLVGDDDLRRRAAGHHPRSWPGCRTAKACRCSARASMCSTAAVSSSPVGTYASVCSGALDPTTPSSYVEGTVTVTAAPLTITASSAPMTYGSTPADDHRVLRRLRQRRLCCVARHDSDVLRPPRRPRARPAPRPSCSGADGPELHDRLCRTATSWWEPATLAITASSGTMTYGGTVRRRSPRATRAS